MRWFDHMHLLIAMTSRDLASRYRSTAAGLGWMVLSPLFTLGIYTFVFTSILKVRWASSSSEDAPFSLVLFTGLIVFSAFSEPVVRAPSLIVSNVNLVKRVVFPLEILPIMIVCTAVVSVMAQTFIVLLALAVWQGSAHWTAVLFPIVLVPVILLALGVTFLLASLGAYLRDLSHAIGILITAAMFLSPVLYPVEAVPDWLHWAYQLNPLTTSIEQARAVLLYGTVPPIWDFGRGLAVGIMALVGGAGFFQWTRKGFADVL